MADADAALTQLLDANELRADALAVGDALAAIVGALLAAGMTDESEIASLAHAWLDKTFPDAYPDDACTSDDETTDAAE